MKFFCKWRSFEEETAKTFGLGLSYIKRSGFKPLTEIFKTGDFPQILSKYHLLNQYRGDIFRNRFTVPVHNHSNHIVGFLGRTAKEKLTSEEKKYKFLNSADSPIYHKKELLFNYNRAKEYIHKTQQVYVVEGIFDVMRLWEKGIKNTVAACGTAFTQNHIKQLKNSEMIFLFDNDKAGNAAAEKALEICLDNSLIPSFIFLDKTQDPDDFFRPFTADQSKEYLYKNKHNFIDFLLKIHAFDSEKDLYKQGQILDKIEEFISKISGTKRLLFQEKLIEKTQKRRVKSISIVKEKGNTAYQNKEQKTSKKHKETDFSAKTENGSKCILTAV